MPSPLGHSIAGLAIATAVLLPLRRCGESLFAHAYRHRILVLAALILSNAPDLDYLTGIGGNLNHAHHWYTHTLGWTVLLSIGAWMLLRRVSQLSGFRLLGACLLISVSHIALDLFSLDYSAPQGVMLVWPFSDSFLYARNYTVFLNLEKNSMNELLSLHNMLAVLLECAITLPFLIFALQSRTCAPTEKMSPSSK